MLEGSFNCARSSVDQSADAPRQRRRADRVNHYNRARRMLRCMSPVMALLRRAMTMCGCPLAALIQTSRGQANAPRDWSGLELGRYDRYVAWLSSYNCSRPVAP